MMKLTFSLLAVLVAVGTTNAMTIPGFGKELKLSTHNNLVSDLQDFINLLPFNEVNEITKDHLENDKQLQRAIEFLFSQEFKDLLLSSEDVKEFKELVKYFIQAGVDVYNIMNVFHDSLGLPEYKPPTSKSSIYGAQAQGGGLRGLVDDILAVVPADKTKALYYQKLQTSPAFARFVAHVKSEKFYELADSLYTNEVFQTNVRKCNAAGLDLNAWVDFLSAIFGLRSRIHY